MSLRAPIEKSSGQRAAAQIAKRENPSKSYIYRVSPRDRQSTGGSRRLPMNATEVNKKGAGPSLSSPPAPFAKDCRKKLRGHDFKLYRHRDLTVQLDVGSIRTNFLNGILRERDTLSIDIKPLRRESLGDLNGIDRAEYLS